MPTRLERLLSRIRLRMLYVPCSRLVNFTESRLLKHPLLKLPLSKFLSLHQGWLLLRIRTQIARIRARWLQLGLKINRRHWCETTMPHPQLPYRVPVKLPPSNQWLLRPMLCWHRYSHHAQRRPYRQYHRLSSQRPLQASVDWRPCAYDWPLVEQQMPDTIVGDNTQSQNRQISSCTHMHLREFAFLVQRLWHDWHTGCKSLLICIPRACIAVYTQKNLFDTIYILYICKRCMQYDCAWCVRFLHIHGT